MDAITESVSAGMLWGVIAPLVALQLVLGITACVACVRSQATRGPKWMWVLIILFVNIVGPIAFFIFGRKEES